MLKRRDTGDEGDRAPRPRRRARLKTVLDEMQTDLFEKAGSSAARQHRAGEFASTRCEAILRDVTAEKGGGKFVMAHLKDDPACDARLKEFKATVRNIPLVDEYDGAGKCVVTGERAERRVVVGKAY